MDVLMPQLGETVAEGTISAWRKKVGDRVEADEILLDVETDKVAMEIPAPGAGTIAEIRVETGETVDVGTVLAVIAGEGESRDTPPAPVEAEESGPSDDSNEPTIVDVDPDEVRAALVPREKNRRLSPAVRRLVAENRLDIDQISGTGRQGRITRRDVLEFIETDGTTAPAPASSSRERPERPAPAARTAASSAAAAPDRAAASAPRLSGGTVPFNRIRKLTAEHMVRSKATSPHVLQAVEVDFSSVERVRKAVRESFKSENGYSLTYLPFIAHAVCSALREFPHANASVQGDSLVLHEHVNLGIAVDLGDAGLVAPVVRAAEALNVTQLAQGIHSLARRARSSALKPDDLVGGTYTISNSGTFGTLITAPIISQPQVAILSTDGVRKKPVVIETADGDLIGIRPIGVLAQSFDHRAIDGAYSAAFLDRVRRLLEGNNWFREL
jgi:pyruvate dehydrogenase E2 component (dihydrolipoamide acetyltransferase)